MSKKEVLAWSLYDFANTAFTSPFRTIFWPLLVVSFLGGNEFQLGLTVGIALLLVSFTAPAFGAYADAANRRMPIIIVSSLLSVLLIALIPLFSLSTNLIMTALIIILYNIALTAYNSLLPFIARPKELGKISGIGMAVGFLGTMFSLGATYLTLLYFAEGKNLETLSGVKATFPVMATFFLIFSLPLFFIIKDTRTTSTLFSITTLYKKIYLTLKNVQKLPGIIPFAISTFLFANALAAIDVFFFLFAKKEFGIGLAGFMLLFAFQSLGASGGAYFFGWLSDKIGAKKSLSLAGFLWIVVISLFLLSKDLIIFWIAGLLGSIAFGAVFSTSRTLLIQLSPTRKTGEFFGYSQIVGKFTGLFGPVVAGWLIVGFGYNAALIFVWITLVLGYLALQKVPPQPL
ncbi:MFS transporter [Candidatus Woesearchaeota archaeon]|nr:MFS transporter [Candidatus Woesearchaeota archaeon]